MENKLIISEVDNRPYFVWTGRTFVQKVINKKNDKELTQSEFDWYCYFRDFLNSYHASADSPFKKDLLKSLQRELAEMVDFTNYKNARKVGGGYIDEIVGIEQNGFYYVDVNFKTGRNESYECGNYGEARIVADSLKKLAGIKQQEKKEEGGGFKVEARE